MSLFRVRDDDAELFDTPDRAAPSVPVPVDTQLDAIPTPNPIWMQVTSMQSPPARTGFIQKEALELLDTPPRAPPADIAVFFGRVNEVARERGADRDYLIALAWAESQGLTQLGAATSSMMGPFMFTLPNWKAAIASPRAPSRIRLSERADWSMQVLMAAIMALDAADELMPLLAKPPTLGMLYFAHVFGIPAAKALLPNMARPFDFTYTSALGAAQFAICQAEHGSLLGSPGSPIRDVFDGLCRKLDAGYLTAAAVLDHQDDPTRFFHAEDDDPRWLMVAREEAFRGVYEQSGADNNARIVQYLHATGLAASNDEIPWCAAFVTFCMQQGNAATTVPHDPARAASWLNWGIEAPADARVPGMVVVLKPQAAGSSGHVGFLLQNATGQQPAPGKIRLLAGNQGNPQRVSAVDFDEAQVAIGGLRVLANMSLPLPEPPATPAPVPDQPGKFRSLVAGGAFSANPDSAEPRSIRTNNPGALNITNWQTQRKGFAGKTRPDAGGNMTTIYFTPEHGVASWFTLLAVRYGLGHKYGLRTLAARYAGRNNDPSGYISRWVLFSQGKLTADSIIETNDDNLMLVLAKAMFHHEAGVPARLHDEQILFGIRNERAGTLST